MIFIITDIIYSILVIHDNLIYFNILELNYF